MTSFATLPSRAGNGNANLDGQAATNVGGSTVDRVSGGQYGRGAKRETDVVRGGANMARSSRLGSSGVLGSRRRRVLGAMISLVALVAVTACGSQEAQWQQPGGSTAKALPAKLTFSHEKDAKDVSPGAPVSVQVIDGTLDKVTLTSNIGEVPGELVNDAFWRSTEDLEYSKTYTLTVKSTGLDGKIVARREFGASAPLKDLLREFGFTVENVVAQAKATLRK